MLETSVEALVVRTATGEANSDLSDSGQGSGGRNPRKAQTVELVRASSAIGPKKDRNRNCNVSGGAAVGVWAMRSRKGGESGGERVRRVGFRTSHSATTFWILSEPHQQKKTRLK